MCVWLPRDTYKGCLVKIHTWVVGWGAKMPQKRTIRPQKKCQNKSIKSCVICVLCGIM